MGYGIVLVATDSKASAEKLTNLLLENRLAGCIQLLPIESHYLWKGKKENSSEILMVIKTHRSKYATIEKIVQDHHPYEIPEILFIPIQEIFPPYRQWLDDLIQEAK
ncbi:MAG: divalent-cation tolerance protein CutA [Brevinematales bacterium]|nr:divalent-cation tolerance protein CutA [Brevinematales bacterium]